MLYSAAGPQITLIDANSSYLSLNNFGIYNLNIYAKLKFILSCKATLLIGVTDLSVTRMSLL
jgi:hypothetical protein